MKKIVLLILFRLLAIPCFGQTTVNLTVQDTPYNQLWNNGTWAVKLVPSGNSPFTRTFTITSGGGSVANQTGSLSGTATASMSLPPNANIAPAGSSWQFTV